MEKEEEVCDLDTSIMLLGMISFVMILFYLTNWPDDDIRFYSWQITSTTISIFCSVMLFQGFNKFLMRKILEPLKHSWGFEKEEKNMIDVIFQFVQCFVYLACIHFGTGIASGVLGCKSSINANIIETINKQEWVYTDALRCTNNTPVQAEDIKYIRAVERAKRKGNEETTETSSVWAKQGQEIPVQKKSHTLIQRKRQTKALGMLFAHLSGFAAIESGKALQVMLVPASDQGCNASFATKMFGLGPVIINQIVLRIAFWVSDKLRESQIKATIETEINAAGDNAADRRKGLDTMTELMKEEVEESENDVSSLSMSALIVNNMVFFITDFLPPEEGAEQKVCYSEKEYDLDRGHGITEVVLLYITGFLMVGIAVAQAVGMAKHHHSLQRYPKVYRILEAVLNATGMCFAWCLIWATKWLAKMFSEMDEIPADQEVEPGGPLFSHEILGRVLLAFMLTAFAAGSVFAVDAVADAMRNSYEDDRDTLQFLEEITRVIVNSLGILVGFSWEHSFDGSVEDVSHETQIEVGEWKLMPAEFQLFLGISVCILILPAWRDFILEKVMLIDAMLKQKRGMSEAHEEHGAHAGEHSKQANNNQVADNH